MSCEVLSSKWTEFSWSSPFANSSSFFLRMRHQRHPIREYKYLSAKAIEFPIFARNTIITGKPTVMYAMNCSFPFVVVGTICPYPKNILPRTWTFHYDWKYLHWNLIYIHTYICAYNITNECQRRHCKQNRISGGPCIFPFGFIWLTL